MESIEMMALVTGNVDDARDALCDLKRLEQGGWIDLTYYALIDRDVTGRLETQEASDPVESLNLTPGEGLAGRLIGRLFEPGTQPESATGPSDTAAHMCAVGNRVSNPIRLEPGESALFVMTDDRYLERVQEELENRGRILKWPLERADLLAALRASIERMKMDVKWLDEFLRAEVAKGARVVGIDRQELDTTIAAARAELSWQCESLNARWRELLTEIEAELKETKQLLDQSGGGRRQAVEQRIRELEGAANECIQALADSVLDHMDRLASHAAALEQRAADAGPGVETEIEGQLHELEVRMRKHRADLTGALGSCALRARLAIEQLRLKSASATPESRRGIHEDLRTLRDLHTALRADLHQIENEDAFLWADFSDGIRRSWHSLCEAIARSNHVSR